jgi:hypothetical protein
MQEEFDCEKLLMGFAKALHNGTVTDYQVSQILERARIKNPGQMPLMVIQVQYLKAHDDMDQDELMKRYKKGTIAEFYD